MLSGVRSIELAKRGLHEATCRFYGYGVAKDSSGHSVQVAQYRDATGAVVAQKVRTRDKDFYTLGSMKAAGLYGQTLWPSRGKRVVVTEGEIDAMSVAQSLSLKWPVVSIPTGADGARKAIGDAIGWLSGYDEVVFWFDNDEAGREALLECQDLLPPGKLKIAACPEDFKDANELLTRQGAQAVVQCIWNAREYRPDGIVSGDDISLEELMSQGAQGWLTPYPKTNELTGGIHPGELWLLTAGSGIGKSTDAREWLYKALSDGKRCGAVFLEENKVTTAKALVALDNNVRLNRLRDDSSILTKAQWSNSRTKLIANGRYFAYDHFGSVESDNLIRRLEYLAIACRCELIWLDHISIAVSGLEIPEGERRAIDVLMTKMRTICERTGVSIIAISHLRKVGGGDASFEQGGQISLDDLRGSGSLKQLSDVVYAKERDQQAEGAGRDLSMVRILKCRYTGNTGPADTLQFDLETGRVKPVDPANLPPAGEGRMFSDMSVDDRAPF